MSIFERCRSAASFSVLTVALSMALASPLALARGGPFKEIDELRQQLQTLSEIVNGQASSSLPTDVVVDCAAGETITAALEQHSYSPAPLTISVSGTCAETVVVLRSNVNIQAAEPGAGVYSEDPLYGAITTGNGVSGIVVEGLKLSGGAHGVLASRNSQVELISVEVTATSAGLVAVDGSLMDVVASDIHGNGSGIVALRNGTVTVADTVIRNNNTGVIAATGGLLNLRNIDGRGNPVGDVQIRNYTAGAVVQLGGNAIISNTILEDGLVGVMVQAQSSAQIAASIIRNNLNAGVVGERNTSLSFGGNEISNNGIGIGCSDNTVTMGWPGVVADNVSANIVGCPGL